MKTEENIKKEIGLGEDSSRQFKEKLNNAVQVAVEMCAMSNSGGGTIYVGVKDNNTIAGLTQQELHTYNQYIASAASDLIKPAIYPQTQTIIVDGKILLLIEVSEGYNKPYCDNGGVYWVKSGSDKRKASPQELLRLFQQSGQMNLDETPTLAEADNIDRAKFYTFFEKLKGQEFSSSGLNIEQVLTNMNLVRAGKITLGGLLLFGDNVQGVKPYCIIRAVAYYGNEISDDSFRDKRDCLGTLEEQFRGAMTFLKNNLAQVQNGKSFNSSAVLEIDERALEEAVVNALLHRDYSKNAVIRIMVFSDRVEIISPGCLPNHLTVENISNGNSVMRNPLLASYGTKILPYSGLGSGIPRILKVHPSTEFQNDVDGEQFVIKMMRVVK